MSREILTPFDQAPVTELSGGARPRYRKQIMRLGTIRYRDRSGTDRMINFDREYLQSLADAFNQRAYDQVAYQLADAQNGHNNDPERFRGELVGVELTSDGLDGIFEPTEAGERLIKDNPRLGVSCRIIEGLEQADGRKFPRAIQHVLGTVNPQLTGMRPWEKVDLAQVRVDQTWDLSGQTQEDAMPDQETVTVELSAENAQRLQALLEDLDAASTLGELIELSDPDGEDGSDESDSNSEDDEGGNGSDELQLANSDQYQLLLARQEASDRRILELTQQMRDRDLQHELQRLRERGLAPAILDAASPLLAVSAGSVELSSPDGRRVDPAQVVREVLQTVLDLSQQGLAVVDLDAEAGYAVADSDPAQTKRDQLLDLMDEQFGR